MMPSVRVREHSELAPEVVLAAALDFSDRRAQMWPDVHVEYLLVHEVGEEYIELGSARIVSRPKPWRGGVRP